MSIFHQPESFRMLKPTSKTAHYLLSVVIICGTALLCSPLANTVNYHVVSFILLFVVSLLSAFMGIGPVLLASTVSALVWDFFFIPPHNNFKIEKTEDLLIFGMFFIIALVNGVLTTRVRHQEMLAREREKRTNALFQLTRELSGASGIEEVKKVATKEINNHFTLEPYFILQDGENRVGFTGREPTRQLLSQDDLNVAQWVFAQSREAGAFTSHPFATGFTFYPLTGTRLKPGIVAIRQKKPFNSEQKSVWDIFIAQVSNAMEREFLGELAQKVRFLDESDRLYKTLFNSISHELRIPVATIMGASDSIIHSSRSRSVQSALCQEIFTASLRLNRLIDNLLNMSRIESGHITVRLDWHDINDLINKVSEELKDELKPFSLVVSIEDEMPLVKMDFGLMEQVLYNLLFNATQFAPAASEILIATYHREDHLIIELSDQGPGFPEADLNEVFNKFFRVSGSKAGGLGLGLTIVKGFVAAHKGTISVENVFKGGAKFTIRIPSEKPDMTKLE